MKTGRVALITGASSGIGAAFARALAAEGHDLVLVARRRDRLESLAGELKEHHAAFAEVLVADLTEAADVERVEARIAELDALEMLINNAGFGTTGRFTRLDVEKQVQMINLHVVASVRLCRAALPRMVERGSGAVINVASVLAFGPYPGNATYGATKAFLVAFSKNLHAELGHKGVRFQALCPGFTSTEFHATPEYERFERSQVPKALWLPAEKVVAGSLAALRRNRVVFVPGFKNRLLVAMLGGRLGSLVLRLLMK
jgi:short-subunit dehydrogenase